MKPISEQGYLILAINQTDRSYTECARRLASSIKRWHKNAEICLVTNSDQPVDCDLFDYQHRLAEPVDLVNAYANDWQIFGLTPFRETVKIEADVVITSPIDHWWTLFRHRDVVISTGCRNWQDQVSSVRTYRKIFDQNHLPDVYNAITYWRRSDVAKEFFDTVKHIFHHWSDYKRLLKFPESQPSTDVVYAMAAVIVGQDQVTLPFASYPKIVHMKRHIAMTTSDDWTQELVLEQMDYVTRIQTVSQWGALHHGIKHQEPV